MKLLLGCLLWAIVAVVSLRYATKGRNLRPTAHSALVSNAANPAVSSRWWQSKASSPGLRLPGLSVQHLHMPRLRLRAATTVLQPMPADVTTSVAVKLLQEIIPKALNVAYACSQTANKGFQATAHVELREINDAEVTGLQDVLSGAVAAYSPWGQLAYTPTPLPIGLFFHRVDTGQEAGANRSSTASFRIRLPGVRSQTILGAISASKEEAEQSAASVLFYSMCNMFRSSIKDMPRSSHIAASDFKTKLSQLLVYIASEQLSSFVVDCEISPVPVGGFVALVQVRGSERVRNDPDRIDSIHSKLRTSVCASRKDAAAAAMDTVYEALLKPLWKTTVKLGRFRNAVLPGLETSENHFQRHLQWRAERLEAITAESLSSASETASSSFDVWFGGVCLCCLAVVSRSSWQNHAAGERHRRSFSAVPVQLSQRAKRPPTEATVDARHADSFLGVAGWADRPGPVLSLGEMDYSFSLALSRLLPSNARLLATSYLDQHDPLELEYHPKGDVERSTFSRRTLPSMDGALERNLRDLRDLGAEVKHGVDATNLQTTLRVRFREPFVYAVFPFPRVTLRRENDPRNSELVHGFFRSALPGGSLISPHGVLQLLLLEGQYEEWDIAGAASAAGLALTGRVAMPRNFYQAREVSGKLWKVGDRAELLCFKRLDMIGQVPMVRGGNRSSTREQNNGRRNDRRNDDRVSFGRSNSRGGRGSNSRWQEGPQADFGKRDSGPQSRRHRRDVPWD